MRNRAATKWPVIVVAVAVLAALAYFLMKAQAGPSGPLGGSSSREVGCIGSAAAAFHIHAHLAIRIEGVSEPVPANIGLGAACTAWIHTHTGGGIIHVEAPREFPATLGMFFDLWGHPLSSSRIGDHAATPGERVFAFVDGTMWSGNPRDIALNSGPVIDLQIGGAALPPLPYRFPSDLR